MPTQLPLEATDFFGDLLFPHVHKILLSDASQVYQNRNYLFASLLFISVAMLKSYMIFLSLKPFEGHEAEKLGDIVSGAVITSNGQLTSNFEYIAKLREAQSKTAIAGDFSSEKKVMI